MAGSPPSSTTSVTTNIPAWAEPYQQQIWQQGYDAIGNLTAEDTQSPYGTISPWNQAQQTATDMQMGLALAGNPLQYAGQGFAYNTLMNGGQNPYADQANPYADQANPYVGDNPYLQATAQNVAGNMANAYETGTRATRDAQAARMGGYGSSGWDAQRQRDEGAFAQQLGNTMNQLYGDEYNRSANLYEQGLNRSANLYEQGLNRATNAYTASQQNNNQLLSQIPNLIGLDWQNIQQLQNAGDRQYAYQQTLLDSLNNDYQNYNNFGINQNNMLGQLLRNLAGTGGSVTTTGGGRSNMGGLLGGLGMAGLGAMFS